MREPTVTEDILCNIHALSAYQELQEQLISKHPKFLFLEKKAKASRSQAELDLLIGTFLKQDFGWLLDLLKESVKRLAQDPRLITPFPQPTYPSDTAFSAIQIITNEIYAVQVVALSPIEMAQRPSGDTIQFSGHKDHYSLLSGAPLSLRRWSCDRFDDATDVVTMSCRAESDEIFSLNDILVVDGRCATISMGAATVPTIYLQITLLQGSADYMVDFDSVTLRYKKARPRNVLAARKMYLISALRNLGHADRTAVLMDAAQVGPFYQRWYAARELLYADPEQGRQLIEEMAICDPNPSVRRAATKTVALINAKEMSGQ